MSQLRLNPLTGRWVTVAAERASRPADFAPRRLPVETGPERPCPFCPGHEEETPPALETYGRDRSWLVRVVPNLYPAFHGSGPMEIDQRGAVFTQAPANGVHEVLVLSPDHQAGWEDLDDKQAGLVMAAVRDRLEDHARRSSVRYTQVIVNHGREAGASLEHPHGQLLGIPFVPGELGEEQRGFARFEGGLGRRCLLCELADAEIAERHRVVIANERVLVICPYWSGAPYEMLVIPRTHTGHLPRSSPPDVVAVGRAVRDALAKLQRLVDPPYNLVFHSSPHHDESQFHWHVHVLPRLSSVAGFEQGTGVMINIVAPEQATADLVG
jgi:UDPglucose--hexose-1-phosphate uridylyltransferase